MRFYECGLEITVNEHNVHIKDSYTVIDDFSKRLILTRIVEKCPFILEHRTINDMIVEWKAHNILHQHKYEEARTKDVDFELHQKWHRKVAYWFIAHIFKEKEE